MPSWTAAVAGSAIFVLLSARAWHRIIRCWPGPLRPNYPTTFARLLTSEQRARIESAPIPGAACLSGITIVLVGGVWLGPGVGAAQANPFLLPVAAVGLGVFLLGFLAGLSVTFAGRPAVLIRESRSTAARPGSVVQGSGRSTGSGGTELGVAEISVLRDDEDSYAQLRRYDVYLDGSRVGRLRRGELCLTQVSGGPHALHVKIDWCSSPVLSVTLAEGERRSFICRARAGAASDPIGAVAERREFLVLREVR